MHLARILATLLLLTSCREGPKVVEYGPTQEEQAQAERQEQIEILASLINFEKLDTLKGDRAANRRVRLIAYHLEAARRHGESPQVILRESYTLNGDESTARATEATRTLLANQSDLESWGCFDAEGMELLKRGNAPTIKKGPHTGQVVSVDHTLPRSIVPSLDEKLFNLRVMAERVNQAKGSRITLAELGTARLWNASGLLSDEGLKAVEKAAE